MTNLKVFGLVLVTIQSDFNISIGNTLKFMAKFINDQKHIRPFFLEYFERP